MVNELRFTMIQYSDGLWPYYPAFHSVGVDNENESGTLPPATADSAQSRKS